MSGTAGWTSLLSGAAAAVLVDVLVKTDVLNISSQAGSFLGASAAFFAAVGVAFVVTQFTTSKSDEELAGLVWALESKEEHAELAVAHPGTVAVRHGRRGSALNRCLLHHLVVKQMSEQLQSEAEDPGPAKPDPMASLFDLRSVIGLLFAVYGLVLTVLGLVGASPEDLAKAGGIALNLWGGLVMLVVGWLSSPGCGSNHRPHHSHTTWKKAARSRRLPRPPLNLASDDLPGLVCRWP